MNLGFRFGDFGELFDRKVDRSGQIWPSFTISVGELYGGSKKKQHVLRKEGGRRLFNVFPLGSHQLIKHSKSERAQDNAG